MAASRISRLRIVSGCGTACSSGILACATKVSSLLGAAGEHCGLAVRQQGENRGAGDGHAAGNAVMTRPGAVLVLHLDDFLLHSGVPLGPFRSAGAAQAVADVQVREELLA